MLDFSKALLGKTKKEERRDSPAPAAPQKPLHRKQPKAKRDRLNRFSGGVFRWLNEQLYTQESSASLHLFADNPEYFDQYHSGFQAQVAQWPVNPLLWVADEVRARDEGQKMKVADLGCGEGKLALMLQDRENVKVFSYDLCSKADHVIVADIAHLPLKDNRLDIAVFCLSLMGSNHVEFLQEARRCLKKSRIPDFETLRSGLRGLGFRVVSEQQQGSDFFHTFVLQRCKPRGEVPTQLFTACRYKPR